MPSSFFPEQVSIELQLRVAKRTSLSRLLAGMGILSHFNISVLAFIPCGRYAAGLSRHGYIIVKHMLKLIKHIDCRPKFKYACFVTMCLVGR